MIWTSVFQTHAEKLKEQYPDRQEEFEQVHQEVLIRLTELDAPLANRRNQLMKQKRVRQILWDIEDENDWVKEKLALIEDSSKLGNSLLATQQLLRRHRMLANEVENHRPRIEAVCQVMNYELYISLFTQNGIMLCGFTICV